MTFNRYILLRMATEAVGAFACLLQSLRSHTIAGLVATALVALVWIGGEIWVMVRFRRANPRSDELSDQHQLHAYRFACTALIVMLCAVGFGAMLLTLLSHETHEIPAMALPALAMAALALADGRYLWLEHAGGDAYCDDEDEEADEADEADERREEAAR